MKIQALSDLYLEFAAFVPDPAAAAAADVIVLAGDTRKGTRGIKWARQRFGNLPIVYVVGNHEFYDHHWEDLLGELRTEAAAHDIYLLENNAVSALGRENHYENRQFDLNLLVEL